MSRQSNKTVARAVVAELQAGRSMKRVSRSLASYLIEERRMNDVGAIIRDVEKQLLVQDETLYVHVTTAHGLSASTQKEITTMFAQKSDAKSVHIEETINPDVIGGVRCETAEHRLDLTVRRQLQRLKGSAA
jgi:ATP synthase F1 delta subunit